MKKTMFVGSGLLLIAALILLIAGVLSYPLKYKELIISCASDAGIDPALVASVVYAESKFRPASVSPRGAVGLMQLMPATAAETAARLGMAQYELKEPSDNLRLGTAYLAALYARYGGMLEETVAAYNAGPGRVDEWLSSAKYAVNGRLTEIPFPETATYVKRVKKALARYEKKF